MSDKEITLLRQLIREFVKTKVRGGSHPDEAYDKELLDDPDFKAGSVYVPKDIKKKIKKVGEKMGFSTK